MGISTSPKNSNGKSDNTQDLMKQMQGTMLQFMQKVEQEMSSMKDTIAKRRSGGSIPSDGDLTPKSRRSESSSPPRKTPKKTPPKKDMPKKEDHSLPPPISGASQAQKGMKSGRDKTATDVVQYNVEWPHYYVTSTDQRPKKYDALSIEDFVYGYMCIMAHEPNPEVQKVMQRHLRELMLDEKRYYWEDVRAFHALVLAGMEAGTLSWLDYQGIQYLRAREGYPNPPKQQQTRRPRDRQGINLPNKDNVCTAFTQGQCDETDDHNGLLHCCKWCLEHVKRTYRHGEFECRNRLSSRSRNAAKNGQAPGQNSQQ